MYLLRNWRRIALLSVVLVAVLIGIRMTLNNNYVIFKNKLNIQSNTILSDKTYLIVVGRLAEKAEAKYLEKYTKNLSLISNIDILQSIIRRLYEVTKTKKLVIAGYASDIKAVLLSPSICRELQKALKKGIDIEIIELYGSKDDKKIIIKAWSDFLNSMKIKQAVIPIDASVANNIKDSEPYALPVDKRIYDAAGLALSVVRVNDSAGTGIFVLEDITDIDYDIAFVAKIFEETPDIVAYKLTIKSKKLMLSNSIIRLEGFKFLGFIGWKHSNMYIGEQWVKTEYYYAEAESGGNKYRFYLAYNIHSQKYYVSLGVPLTFATVTDWKTRTYSGQVLWDWGPKNWGCGGTVSIELSAGGAGASVGISYSAPLGAVFCYYDNTDPGDGVFAVTHQVTGNSLPFVTYTVEPSSIGLLDPTRPGGTLPMIVSHRFVGSYGGSIAYTVALYYPSHVPPIEELDES